MIYGMQEKEVIMKYRRVLIQLSIVLTLIGCGKSLRPSEGIVGKTEEEKQAQEKQIEIFQEKLKDTSIGEVERQYLQFRLALLNPTSSLSLSPTLAQAFSNEFINGLWNSSAYRSAYLTYLSLTNMFTNSSIDRGFLLGRAGIAAFKAKQYTLALSLFHQAFEIQVSDETVYYYGLWHWYVQKDKEKAKQLLSRVRPERVGIHSSEWTALFADDSSRETKREYKTVMSSSNRYYQVLAFQKWLQDYSTTGEPFWSYSLNLPAYIPTKPTNRFVGYYLSAMPSQFPRMTRDWPLPFSVRPGKPGQNRYSLFLEEPLSSDRFLLLYAQPVNFPWESGYKGISPVSSRLAYTNAFFVYAAAQRDTNNRLTNVALETVSLPLKYFLGCSWFYHNGRWKYALVGFLPPDTLEVIVFDPVTRVMSHVSVPLLKVNSLYYVDYPPLGRPSWVAVGDGIFTLQEKFLNR